MTVLILLETLSRPQTTGECTSNNSEAGEPTAGHPGACTDQRQAARRLSGLTDPALQTCTGGGLHHVRRVHTHIQAQN